MRLTEIALISSSVRKVNSTVSTDDEMGWEMFMVPARLQKLAWHQSKYCVKDDLEGTQFTIQRPSRSVAKLTSRFKIDHRQQTEGNFFFSGRQRQKNALH